MTRTITVTQPGLVDSSLTLSGPGSEEGRFSFAGLLKRSAQLDLAPQRLTFTTLGLFGRSVRVTAASETVIGRFQQTGILGRGDAEVHGRRYRLKVTGVLRRRYEWITPEGTTAMNLRLGGFIRTTGTIEIAETGASEDAAALIGLGLMARRAIESDSGGGAGSVA